MLNIKDNQRELNSANSRSKRLIQAERGEIFYREDIKYSFVYALVGVTVITIAVGVGYVFVQQLRK